MSEYNEEEEEFMSDDDDEDDYEDDDEGQHDYDTHTHKEEPRDEQKEQAYNGKIEVLQQEVFNLREELAQEKKYHEQTKKLVDESIMKTKSTDNFISSTLMNEFKSFCEHHDIHTHSDFNELHEEDVNYILQEITHKIHTYQEQQTKIKTMKSNSFTALPTNDNDMAKRIRNLEEELRMALGGSIYPLYIINIFLPLVSLLYVQYMFMTNNILL
jgi:hypothetical protein